MNYGWIIQLIGECIHSFMTKIIRILSLSRCKKAYTNRLFHIRESVMVSVKAGFRLDYTFVEEFRGIPESLLFYIGFSQHKPNRLLILVDRQEEISVV